MGGDKPSAWPAGLSHPSHGGLRRVGWLWPGQGRAECPDTSWACHTPTLLCPFRSRVRSKAALTSEARCKLGVLQAPPPPRAADRPAANSEVPMTRSHSLIR